ncbi:MAG: hypothetical protein IJW77_04745 [Clostridia bacterium]|nr:hypothetical protein [Clostridia bacterium]
MTCKGRVNRKRTVLKIPIITITILILLLLPPLLVTLFESGTEIRWNMYMDGYRDYYRYRMDYELHAIFESRTYTRLWFKPSQKEQLLNKIKDDVNEILIDIQTQVADENITIDYEISDDFKNITLYIDHYETYMQMGLSDESDGIHSWNLSSEIGMRVVLYHELLYSINHSDDPYEYGNAIIPHFGSVVDLVYNGSEANREKWLEEQEQEREKNIPNHWKIIESYHNAYESQSQELETE